MDENPGKILVHQVVVTEAPEQPLEDHHIFVSGNLDVDFHVEIPPEVLYIPLATWMGMNRPQVVTLSVELGQKIPTQLEQHRSNARRILQNYFDFDKRCRDSEYTDTGEAWLHMNALSGILEKLT